MRLLYNIFFILFAVFYIPNLLWKGKFHHGFLERFGFLSKDITSHGRPIWVHAVSVGEASVAVKLSRRIKEVVPGARVVVSTTTRTGNDMVRKSGAGTVDAVFYYPLDLSFIARRVVNLVKPSWYLMIETEIWPNLLMELHSKGIPIILANGRISDRSFARYRRIRFITGRILSCINSFCMQSGEDAERIKAIGAPAERVHVTGNIKFDEKTSGSETLVFTKNTLGFNDDDKIIVAGSTHFPEEKIVIDAYIKLKAGCGNLKLILAPRHVERCDAVRVYIEKANLKYCLFSAIHDSRSPLGEAEGSTLASRRSRGIHDPYDILLVDTIGHLKDLYGAGDMVFIGGSLVEKGGQNPIEAARWGKPIIFGPHMFNFRAVADIFLRSKAAVCVKDASHLIKVMEELLQDAEMGKSLANAAQKVIEDNAGAIDKTIQRIVEIKKAKIKI